MSDKHPPKLLLLHVSASRSDLRFLNGAECSDLRPRRRKLVDNVRVHASDILPCNSLQLAAFRTDTDKRGGRKHGDDISYITVQFAESRSASLACSPPAGLYTLSMFLFPNSLPFLTSASFS